MSKKKQVVTSIAEVFNLDRKNIFKAKFAYFHVKEIPLITNKKQADTSL